ncbi:MAG: sugar porter family MFS transporter [Cyclobacteriaceae bacterium]|nr:sugar porter family MFS transporter [Cyclobacteriaceae bacterium]MCH8518034.1 sugar porter family MFS transporter [Cyclobacteriaceae bacterium]
MPKGKKYVVFLSITAALGGFLFGFDTAVISGAEREIQQVWRLGDLKHGLAVAIALYGTILGALLGGIPANRFGRKATLFWIGILYFISALGSAFSPEVYSFMFFRFLGGLGVGASSVVAPMYISEIAPANRRGQLVALYQFNIVLGILIAYFSNYLIGTASLINSWRWMLGVEAIPAFLYTLLILKVPRSPRWLIAKRGQYEAAREILTRTDPDGADEAIRLAQGNSLRKPERTSYLNLWEKKIRPAAWMAIIFAAFNQLSGINAIIYFAPRIFESAGITTSDALLSTIGIGIVNLLATLLGLYLIDKMGRKFLMYIGSVGYIVSLSLIASTYLGGVLPISWLPTLIFLFIASHAIGQGSVIWVFIGEIFPNALRAYGQSIGSFTHWILAAIIANTFPYFAAQLGAGLIFSFFAGMMVLQLIWVWIKMPETKGRSLENISQSS